MGNDQLLPTYNIQIGIVDEYIAVVDVNHYRSDTDCFVPFNETLQTNLWLLSQVSCGRCGIWLIQQLYFLLIERNGKIYEVSNV